jgi:hypothetical protein
MTFDGASMLTVCPGSSVHESAPSICSFKSSLNINRIKNPKILVGSKFSALPTSVFGFFIRLILRELLKEQTQRFLFKN